MGGIFNLGLKMFCLNNAAASGSVFTPLKEACLWFLFRVADVTKERVEPVLV